MTLQISSQQLIGGLPAPQVRRFFRRIGGDGFSNTRLRDFLQLSDRKTAQVIRALIREGYVLPTPGLRNAMIYEFTELGESLARASAATRVTRKKADHALAGLLERVNEINSSPKYLYRIAVVVVFGSYLSDAQSLGDLDVAVRLESRIRNNEERVGAECEHARNSGRSFPTFVHQLSWAQDEVLLALKARKRTLSIQPWYSFVGMEKQKDFRYEVVLGDAAAVQAELAAQETKHASSRG